MMDNICVNTYTVGNIKPDKEKSTEKIYGAVATIMALDRATLEIKVIVVVFMMKEGY